MGQKKKLIAFLVLMIVVVSVFCAVMMKNTKQQTLTVTDAEGVTYVAILDQNQEVYAGVTDQSGNMYAAKIENGVVLKDQPLYIIDNYTGTYPYNDTTRGDDIVINQNNGDSINLGGEAQTKAPTQPSETTTPGAGENPAPTETTAAAPKEASDYMSDKFIKLFNSGVFAMTFLSDDPDLTEDITIAMRNGSVYMDTSMEGISCKVLFDSNKNSGYIIIPQLRVYCLLPEDLAKDMATSDFSMPEISDAKSAEVYEVTIDGKDCVCEEFKYGDGTIRTYYFYNGNLIRMTVIEDGETTLYNIKSLSSDVDSSYFELPKGYLKVNLSWLQTQAEA